MTPKKVKKENLSENCLHIEKYRLVKVKHMTGKGRSKNETELHYRVKAFFEKYYNKWWSITAPRK